MDGYLTINKTINLTDDEHLMNIMWPSFTQPV